MTRARPSATMELLMAPKVKAAARAPRVERASGERLRVIVRERCILDVNQLAAPLGWTWSENLEADLRRHMDRSSGLVQLEQARRAALAAYEAALAVFGTEGGGRDVDAFADRLRAAVKAVMPDSVIMWRDAASGARWYRRRALLWAYDLHDLMWWRGRGPTTRELALLSLLGGEFPTNATRATAAEVIKAEARAMLQARVREKKQSAPPST